MLLLGLDLQEVVEGLQVSLDFVVYRVHDHFLGGFDLVFDHVVPLHACLVHLHDRFEQLLAQITHGLVGLELPRRLHGLLLLLLHLMLDLRHELLHFEIMAASQIFDLVAHLLLGAGHVQSQCLDLALQSLSHAQVHAISYALSFQSFNVFPKLECRLAAGRHHVLQSLKQWLAVAHDSLVQTGLITRDLAV